ncbi:DUF533 domain-containing protein [Mesorhizobium sp. NBSH29]|uniref:tellurite resistance TerB family protein n=1 Tax=Mesorhizobium sp. NBSH29 TaxID=2654249 RepID=UPI0018968303|nr:tellurite resistance TerB family protein [Mesorhizobium sp. NBSH29]QPC85429.1 DUF533 domain-containing protein [Mesorhizobium sp. NBSH29]
MLDPKRMLDELLGTKIPGSETTLRDKAGQATQMAKDNPLAAGALLAVLLGTGTGRAVTGSAIKLGGLAAVAGVAYNAYKNYQNGGAPVQETASADGTLLPPPQDSGFHPTDAPQGEDEFALTLIRAMISAANADGHVDDEERKKIGDRLALSGLGDEAQQFFDQELRKPATIDELVAAARSEAQRIELFTAARLTIDPNTRVERGYLDMLAGRLELPDALVDHVEATISSVKSADASATNSPW